MNLNKLNESLELIKSALLEDKTKDLFKKIRSTVKEKEFLALQKEIDDLAQSGEIKFKDASKLMQAIDSRMDKLGMGL